MKKISTTIVVLSLLVHAFTAEAKGFFYESGTDTLQAEVPAEPVNKPAYSRAMAQGADSEVFRKNNVKINASSILLNNYSFSYERSLTRKISFVAGYRYMPEEALSDLRLVNILEDKYEVEMDDADLISSSNNTYTGEFRFYGGRHAGARGFYLSVYGRYTDMKVNYQHEYETERYAYDDFGYVTDYNYETYTLPLQSSVKGFGGGLMIGAQWLIAKRVVLDWYIIGAHYGKLKGDGSALADLSTLSASEKQELEDELNGLIEVKGKTYIDASVTDRGADFKVDGPFLGIRGLGFNLGIAF